MNPHNFFAELKRRNVYKVAITYAVVAWLLIQAASILLPTFEAPAWVMKAFVVLLAFGFVISVMISWAFEATPEGLKRTKDVSPEMSLPSWSARKFAAFIISLALIAAGLFAFQFLRPVGTSRRDVGQIEEGHPWSAREEPVQMPGSRYVDWLIPGIVGLSIMGTSMWGIGFAIVQARMRKLLKRLVASPMRKGEYLIAQVIGRLVLLAPEAGAPLVFGALVLGMPIRGSILSTCLVCL